MKIGPSPRVTIVGAGNVGSALAQRLAERDLADVVLIDIVEGRPQGIALDLMQSRGLMGHSRRIVGTHDYADTADSQVVVITAGLPRRPGMTRDDLLQVNGKIVSDTVAAAVRHSPDALYIVVTNPLDVMTYVAWQVSGLPAHRVMGMAGILDSARFQTFIAMALGVPPEAVAAMVLGGHGDLMVPLPQYATVNGVPVSSLLPAEALDQMMERTRNGGAEVVGLLKHGGAFYAPAAAVAQMVEALLRGHSGILPMAAYLEGQYGLRDLYLGVPCRLGPQGVEQIVELPLEPEQRQSLERSAAAVSQNIKRIQPLIAAKKEPEL